MTGYAQFGVRDIYTHIYDVYVHRLVYMIYMTGYAQFGVCDIYAHIYDYMCTPWCI